MSIKTIQVKKISDIPYSINADIVEDEPSHVRFIEYNLTAQNGLESLCSVQIGKKSSVTEVYPEIASKVDQLLEKLENFLEFGDHESIVRLSLLVVNSEYRLFADFENSYKEVNFTDLSLIDDKLLEFCE